MKLLSSKLLSALALAVLTGANALSVRQSAEEKISGTVEMTIKNGDFTGGDPKEAFVQFNALSVPFYKTKTVKIKDESNVEFPGEPKASFNMYGEDVIEVDVVWPGAFSDSKWIGYIRKDEVLAAKNEVKTVEVDMGDLGKLNVDLKYIPLEDQKIGTIPNTYFDEQDCSDVKLYNDAHVTQEMKDMGETTGTWDDLYEDMGKAEHFIYAVGWAIWKDLKMIRPDGLTLEEFFKKRASEGIQIVLMPWGNLADSVMVTYDNLLFKTFEGVENVFVVRPPRRKGAIGPNFSHHQKTVMMDIDGELVAYVGGLDLTSGRYDDQSHPLFRQSTPDDEADYYQYTIAKAEYGVDPREPWHDIHMRLTNKGALDVYNNFKDRIMKEQDENTKPADEVKLYEVEKLPKLTGACPSKSAWRTQLVRSIDTSSALFPRGTSTLSNRLTGKQEVDDSMVRAWLHLINGAQKYVWIEQQYFLGSGQWWDDSNMDLTNQIPIALGEKIASMIRQKKDFAVYAVCPLFPEGIPTSTVVQEMLFFQSQSVQAIMRKVAAALKEVGSDADPTEYFHFTFPAQRVEDPAGGIDSAHTIYVHAKHLIVDDSFSIIGSANINDRSMAGDRDTEIGVVAHEDGKVLDGETLPDGEVAKHRKRLFMEHLGKDILDKCADPSTAECRQAVKARTDENLELFLKPLTERVDLKSHLTSFPYQYSEKGDISADPNMVPHMDGSLLGETAAAIPDFTTTRRRSQKM